MLWSCSRLVVCAVWSRLGPTYMYVQLIPLEGSRRGFNSFVVVSSFNNTFQCRSWVTKNTALTPLNWSKFTWAGIESAWSWQHFVEVMIAQLCDGFCHWRWFHSFPEAPRADIVRRTENIGHPRCTGDWPNNCIRSIVRLYLCLATWSNWSEEGN